MFKDQTIFSNENSNPKIYYKKKKKSFPIYNQHVYQTH